MSEVAPKGRSVDLRSTQASLTLDFLRALAAQVVLVGHAIGSLNIVPWAQPPHAPYMQNVGVLVFFLLSGFLIAYTLDTKSKGNTEYGYDAYLIDRFARIYSALVPALFVVLAIDVAGDQLKHTHTIKAFLGNLLMLQNVQGPYRWLEVPAFGTAGQLWTLALEWHIYLFAGALFFIRRGPSMILIAIMTSVVPILYWGRVHDQDFGHGVMQLWVAGFAIYHLLPHLIRLPMWIKFGIAAVCMAGYLFVVTPGAEYKRVTYLLLIPAFGAIVTIAASLGALPERAVARAIRFCAGYSFTLYLVHNSVVKAAVKVWTGDPYVIFVLIFIVANLISIAVAMPTEMRHRLLATYLHRRLRHRNASSGGAADRIPSQA